MCVSSNLKAASRVATRMYDQTLRPVGILSSQLPLLALIDEAGTITMTELASRLSMDRTTLGRNLKPLERDGLVTIEAGDDRRTRWLRITPAGEAVLIRAYPLWMAAQQQIDEILGEADVRSLIQGLKALQDRRPPQG